MEHGQHLNFSSCSVKRHQAQKKGGVTFFLVPFQSKRYLTAETSSNKAVKMMGQSDFVRIISMDRGKICLIEV